MSAGWPGERPGAVYRLVACATDPDPAERTACIPPARRAIRLAAARWGVGDGVLDDLAAVAGELLANATQHAGPARRSVVDFPLRSC
ncbi:hypothetical protein [Streptomyces sp. Y1]|uniref:ATP-binding protein n=1 Tax=Streptomyces sp. Y1 TaxID=3238634 RepID=A0AB39TWV5_9ACTN